VPISVASNERFKAPCVRGKLVLLALSALVKLSYLFFSFLFQKRRAKLVIKVGQDSPSGQEKTKQNKTKNNRVFRDLVSFVRLAQTEDDHQILLCSVLFVSCLSG